MRREACKFFSGAFGGLAYAHAGYALATSAGIVDEPVFRNRRWGVEYMWTEAVVYAAISLALGYAGWSAKSEQPQEKFAIAEVDGRQTQPVGPGEPAESLSR